MNYSMLALVGAGLLVSVNAMAMQIPRPIEHTQINTHDYLPENTPATQTKILPATKTNAQKTGGGAEAASPTTLNNINPAAGNNRGQNQNFSTGNTNAPANENQTFTTTGNAASPFTAR